MNTKMRINNRSIAIRHFCADCAGSPLDVTLCTIFHCDLWPWRIGEIKSKSYKKRVGDAFSRKTFALEETLSLGLTLEDFLHPSEAAISKTRPLGDEDFTEEDGKEVVDSPECLKAQQGDALTGAAGPPEAQKGNKERRHS